MDSKDLANILSFIKAAEGLKHTLRSGRTSNGRQESTAEHSWRLALFASVLQDEMGELDQLKVLALCLVHDLGETLGGDVPATENHDPEEKSARERRDLATLTASLPPAIRTRILSVWEEYEAGASPEAVFVKGLDKLETIIQHNQGHNRPDFDYAFNLAYGVKQTARHPLLAGLRAMVDVDTQTRIAPAAPGGTVPCATPASLPDAHRQFLARCLPVFQADARVRAIYAGGSFARDTMDAYSDLDLLIVVADQDLPQLRQEMRQIAAGCGDLLAAFTGEHVGQPDLLICLFDQPLLHVDLKFASTIAPGYALLWAGQTAPAIPPVPAAGDAPDLDWIEARFWTWMHYGAGKIARGELLEAVDFLAFLRMSVLGPLALALYQAPPYGVRRIETALPPALAARLAATVCSYEVRDCLRAFNEALKLYLELRERHAGAGFGDPRAQSAAQNYLLEIADRFK
ncbi:HD domain-containing protein [Massilia sp. CF038]|uniref:HD domain-containing protein n=1 Tax=Massilia sp. CF038 TaxID=1881045 RepID=UPI00091C4036|nr:HD domain-containing protein [Massilia sp. CF038]SHH09346.1 5'-deoxynucleotidase YfbR [Massilia sp. CF038]